MEALIRSLKLKKKEEERNRKLIEKGRNPKLIFDAIDKFCVIVDIPKQVVEIIWEYVREYPFLRDIIHYPIQTYYQGENDDEELFVKGLNTSEFKTCKNFADYEQTKKSSLGTEINVDGSCYQQILEKDKYVLNSLVEGERKAYVYKIWSYPHPLTYGQYLDYDYCHDWDEIVKILNENSNNWSSVWDQIADEIAKE